VILGNDPHLFADQALAGFVAVHPDEVLAVPGGIVRTSPTREGGVAIVMGGGSGHFPAFAGWVGPGLGHGAACGDVFSSPSATQIETVAHAANGGAGVLFVPINYAGDMLNFTEAMERMRADGVPVRMVAITDDIASGGPEEHTLRRGVAGSLLVLKMVGAAAETGTTLEELERIAVEANNATRTLGVAFGGCTLPGAAEPLFSVPEGRIAVGLGIHGEPGISEAPRGSADEVADLIVDRLLEERPLRRGGRVAMVVNGLGSTKYDELFIVSNRVIQRLVDFDIAVIAPAVGEFMTSLDMAGLSVSITELNDERERLWLAPADTPAFGRDAFNVTAERRQRPPSIARSSEAEQEPDRAPASPAALLAVASLERAAAALALAEEELGALDSVAGDGDHGRGMVRGSAAALATARAAADRGASCGEVLIAAGRAWSDEAGGTSGALWGAGLTGAGAALGTEIPDVATLKLAARAFLETIQRRGSAQPGDKTMIDAIAPFVETLEASPDSADAAVSWATAVAAARAGAAATAQLRSRRGRSRAHGDRSVGVVDPGAMSFALVVDAMAS